MKKNIKLQNIFNILVLFDGVVVNTSVCFAMQGVEGASRNAGQFLRALRGQQISSRCRFVHDFVSSQNFEPDNTHWFDVGFFGFDSLIRIFLHLDSLVYISGF